MAIDGLAKGPILVPAFSPDGKLVAAAHGTTLVKVWDAATGQEVFSSKYADRSLVCDAAFSPDGKRLAACGYYHGIRIWDLASREIQSDWVSESGVCNCVAFSSDGKRLAVGGILGMVEVLDTATGKRVQTFKGHLGPVRAIAFRPDGTRLATGSADGTLRVWDVSESPDTVSIPKEGASGRGITQLSPDGRTLLTDFQWGQQGLCGSGTLPRASRAAVRSSSRGLCTASHGPPTEIVCTLPTPPRPSASWTSRPAR